MITPADAADAINYLLAADAVHVVDNMHNVWANYINDTVVGVPDVQQPELLPAARRTVQDKAQGEYSKRDALALFVKALKANRRDRVDAEQQAHGHLIPEGLGDKPELEAQWKRHALRLIGGGMPRREAENAAYAAVGVPAPQPETLISNPTQIRNLIETAKRNIAVNRASAPPGRQTGSNSTHVRGRA